MDEKPLSSTEFVVESLEVVLDEKLLLREKPSVGEKSLLDKKPLGLTKFVVESLEVVLDEKLFLGEKQYVGGKSLLDIYSYESNNLYLCGLNKC